MSRPRRLYLSNEGKYYYIENNKKKFIRVPPGMSQKQVQAINIRNIIGGPARRMRRKKKKTKIAYQKRVVKDTGDMIRGYTAGLPLYYFTPQKNITIDIAKKAADTTIDKLVDLLKGATPVINAPKMPPPPVSERRPRMPTPPPPERRPRVPTPPPPRPVPGRRRAIDELAEAINTEYEKSKEFIRKARGEVPITGREIEIRKRGEEMAEREIEMMKELRKMRRPPKDDFITRYIEGRDDSESSSISPWSTDEDSKENTDMGEEKFDGEGKKGDDGLYNDQIQDILQKRIKNFVPVVPADKVEELLRYVGRGDKQFAAVVNTDDSSGAGKHWTCVFFDNRDDFPSCEFFDPLAEDGKPSEALLSVMRKISKRMNPEKYFKYKFNKIRRQSLLTSNCGYHVCKFIEDRYNGIPFSEASGYDDYMKRQKGNGYEAPDDSKEGEKEIKPYMSLLKKNFSSYL